MTPIMDSLEVLLEMLRVDYSMTGKVRSFVSYLKQDSLEPQITYDEEKFDQIQRYFLNEFAEGGEDEECVYLKYRSDNKFFFYVAEKDLLESGFLKPWRFVTCDVKGIEGNKMLPSKDDIVKQVQQTIERKDWSKQAVKVMKKSSDAVLGRVQQNVSAQLQEDTAPIIQNFVINLSRSLMDATANFLEKSRDATVDLPVFPVGTRYIKQDGQVLNVVIEQPPQARTVFFTNDAASTFDSHINGNGRSQSYYLAMPYTIFVLQFVNGQYAGELNVFWRNRPLGTISDEMALMPFPNISGGKVCLGDFRVDNRNHKVDDQCNQIISGFWQTIFGSDYVDRFSKFMSLNNIRIDRWVENSKKNPLYALDLKLQPANVKLQQTFRQDATNSLVTLLKQHILTAVGQIGGEVQKLLVDLDVTGENREKVHVETMSEIVKEIIIQAYAELWEQLSIKLEKERAVDAQKNKEVKDRMKHEFMEWVRQTYPQLQKSTW